MKLINITIEGFGSIVGPYKHEFITPSLSIIRGKNGSGKTTFLMAISWALYGKTLKDNSTIPSYPTLNNKGTKVELNYIGRDNCNYTLIRCMDYNGKVINTPGKNRLILIKEGISYNIRSKQEVQKLIQDSIGISFELFKNSVIFGQKVSKLSQVTGVKRKEILEEAFNLTFIDEAREEVSQLLNVLVPKSRELLTIIRIAQAKVDSLKDSLVEIQKDIDEVKKSIDLKEISEIKGELKKLPKIKTLESIKKWARDRILNCNKHNEKVAYLKNKRDTIKRNISENNRKHKELDSFLSKILANLKSLENSQCDTCGQKIESSEKVKSLIARDNLKRVEVVDEITKLGYENGRLRELLEDIPESPEEMDDSPHWDRIKWADETIRKRHKLESQLVNRGNKGNNYINTLEKRVIDGTERLKVLEGEITPFIKEKAMVDSQIEVQQWLLKTPLGSSGLKNYILSIKLKQLNGIIREYCKYLPFNIHMEINLESGRRDVDIIITTPLGPVIQGDLSGGESHLVDIVIVFSLVELVSLGGGSNILFLDELFESLDSDNIPLVSEIASRLVETKSVYIITHQDNFKPVNSREIRVLKVKGVTTFK